MSERRTLKGKRLLVASFGLGAASVIGCNGCSEPEPVGNLVAPPQEDLSDPSGGAGSGGEDETGPGEIPEGVTPEGSALEGTGTETPTDPASDDSDGGP